MSCCQMLGLRAVWGKECGLDLLPGRTSAAVAVGAVGVAAAPSKSDSSTCRIVIVQWFSSAELKCMEIFKYICGK